MNTSEQFDKSKYLVNSSKPQSASLITSEPGKEQFDPNQFIVREPSRLDEPIRHIARTASRIGETVAGFPGDFVKFVKFISEKLPSGPEFLKQKPTFVQEAGKKIIESLPGSEDIKKFSQNITKGYTAPQDEKEQFADDIVSLGTALAIPAKNPKSFIELGKTVAKSLGFATVAKGVGKGVELLGGEKGYQLAAELGTLMLGSFIKPGAVNQYISNLYSEARSQIPKGTMVSTRKLTSDLANVKNELKRGTSTPSKDAVIKQLEEVEKKAAGGAMELDDLAESFHSINENLTAKKLWDELGTSQKKITRTRFDKLRNAIRDTINDNPVPGFTEKWNAANEGLNMFYNSKRVGQYIQDNIKHFPAYLAGTLAVELFTGYPKTAAATLGAAGLVKSGEVMAQIARSKTLRKHYGSVMESALKENLPATVNNLKILNQELAKKDVLKTE